MIILLFLCLRVLLLAQQRKNHEFLIFYILKSFLCPPKVSSADEHQNFIPSWSKGCSRRSPWHHWWAVMSSRVQLLLQSCSFCSQFVSKQLSLQLTWFWWDLWNTLANNRKRKEESCTTRQPKPMSVEKNWRENNSWQFPHQIWQVIHVDKLSSCKHGQNTGPQHPNVPGPRHTWGHLDRWPEQGQRCCVSP